MLKASMQSAGLMIHAHQTDAQPPTAPAPGLSGPTAQIACAPDREHAQADAATATIRPQLSLRPVDPASPPQPPPQPPQHPTPLHMSVMAIMRNRSATTPTSSAMRPA